MGRVSITSAIPAKATEFNPDYTYIKRDLRRIGALAVSFLAILIALSFFLR
jgi:hypothetical protein